MIFRTYPVSRYLILLIVGIVVYDYTDWNTSLLLLIFGCLLCIGFLAVHVRRFYFLRHLIPLSFFFLGIAITGINDQKSKPSHISNFENLEGSIVKIDSYTETKAKTYKALAKVIAVNDDGVWKQATGKIIVYFSHSADVFPRFGEIYLLNSNLKEIEAPKNPFEFDYKKYQARKNIYNHQFLREGDFKKLGEDSKKSIFYFSNRANNYTHQVFSQVLDNQNQLGVAEAIIGGMRSELTGEVRNWYTQTGTVHALAVSGLHVGILFMVLNFVIKRILNPRKIPFIITVLVLLWTYAVFTGLSPSVCRATLMFSIFQIGMYIRRDTNYINVLLFSALVLLLIVPWWIFDIGFQLSHLAVLGILALYPRLNKLLTVKNKILKSLWDVTTVSIAAQIYTLPLTLYYFQQFPNYFLIANPLISLFCFMILPSGFLLLLLFKVPVIGFVIGLIFKLLIQLMISWVYLVYQLPFSVSEGLSFYIWDVVLLFAVLFLFQSYLRTENLSYFKASLVGLTLILILGTGMKLFQDKQKEVTFHYIPNGVGVSYIKGRAGTFLSTDSLINESLVYQYHLKNYYNTYGINKVNKIAIDEGKNELISIDDMSIYWIKNPENPQIAQADIILVSNGTLDPDLDVNAQFIVFDGSNQRRYLETMKKKYNNAVVLYDTGSTTFSLK